MRRHLTDVSTEVESAPPDSSRRDFLQRAALTSAAAFPASLLMTGVSQAARPKPKPGGVQLGQGGQNRALPLYFKEIMNDENAHVELLTNLLGFYAGPAPTFKNLGMPNIQTFYQTTQALENTGVGAYILASPLILNANILQLAAQILSVEAYHSGFINTFNTTAMVPGASPLGVLLPADEIVKRATPFIDNLNGPLPTLPSEP
ncbi:MAG: ferritin-like domain-containing protein, partial [Isosphaeraceae bacterium]